MQKPTKELTILARAQYKSNSKAVLYCCLSSNGTDRYETTVYAGKATHCTCPATKPCYHMTGCERLEADRKQAAQERYLEFEFQMGGYDHYWN